MKFIDWFSGIGGFRRGMELAGHECVLCRRYERETIEMMKVAFKESTVVNEVK